MTKKVEISKVIIKIGDAEHELTVAQARELKAALNELLGDGSGRLYPYVIPNYPIWRYEPFTISTGVSNNTIRSYTARLEIE